MRLQPAQLLLLFRLYVLYMVYPLHAFHPSSPMACFLGGGGGRGLSILDVEHSVCSYSLQRSPYESYFLSRPFDTLNFSCTLRPVFCSYCFNPCLAFFFLNSPYSLLALDSDQQKKFNSDHEKKNIISRRHLPFTRHFVFCHELVVG